MPSSDCTCVGSIPDISDEFRTLIVCEGYRLIQRRSDGALVGYLWGREGGHGWSRGWSGALLDQVGPVEMLFTLTGPTIQHAVNLLVEKRYHAVTTPPELRVSADRNLFFPTFLNNLSNFAEYSGVETLEEDAWFVS